MSIKGVVATGHPQTSLVAQQILEQGGNAFDATVAGYFMACVAEPVMASLGGGGFLVAQNKSGDPFSMDFFVQTPLAKRKLDELDFEEIIVDFGSTTQAFHMGHGSVATPGCVKGIFEIHRQFCRMPIKELIAPAISAAKQGLPITADQAAILSLVKPIYINRESARSLFVKNNNAHVLCEGEHYINPDLSEVFDVLAHEGEAFFYRGEIAQAIQQVAGGSITPADLHAYEVQWRKPLKSKFREAEIYLNPPPSAGGMLVQFAMQLMAGDTRLDFHSRNEHYYQRLASAIELTQQARIEALLKSPLKELEKENFLNADQLQNYQDKISSRHKNNHGTTHLSVADSQGNVVAFTISNGEGCGEILADTGIMLNNMLGEDDLNPLGLNQWDCNRRLSSMMCPGLAINDTATMALGSGGSNRIRTAVLQVLINHMLSDLSLKDSVKASRLHFDDKLYLELTDMDDVTIEALKRAYPDLTQFPARDFYFGGVNAVSVGEGNFQAVADPRRGGAGVVVN